MHTPQKTAHDLLALGYSPVPVTLDGSKRPAVPWKTLLTTPATPEQIDAWFDTPTSRGIGVATGAVSGNLVMIEVEGRAAHRLDELKTAAKPDRDLWNRVSSGWIEKSPSGGYHWFIRLESSAAVPGNTKLAVGKDRQVIAETRGEGGFVVLAPTGQGQPSAHATGHAWELLIGGPHQTPVLTLDEYETLCGIFRTLDERPEPTPQEKPALARTALQPTGGNEPISPGDDFEANITWAEILEPHGWQVHSHRGNETFWTRPGKNPREGHSASTGFSGDRDRLWVFTSSTDFQQETPYTKFGAWAHLNHGGDHKAAAEALRRNGFGKQRHLDPSLVPLLDGDPFRVVPKTPKPAPTGTHEPHTGTNPPTPTPQGDPKPETAPERPLTILAESDDGLALVLIARHGHRLRYHSDRGRWLHWTGTVWAPQPADGGIARELAKACARELPETDTKEIKHKRYALSNIGLRNTLQVMQTDPRIAVTSKDLDAHPWELNTPTGIVNLRTGELQPHDPAKLHTKITRFGPQPDADPTLWNTFITQTFPNKCPVADYVQRLVGYSVVGVVAEHVLPFAFGEGGNGKGVFLESIMAVLGDYATSTPAGFLMGGGRGEHPTEIADLHGIRFAVSSEVKETDRFDEAKVKALTGGDTIKARFMRQDFFAFAPTHTLWLMGNHEPAVESGGRSFWRRFRKIPFVHRVPEEDQIKDLQGLLAREHGPALMNWIIEGAVKWAKDGLQEPDEVKAATDAYASSTDTVRMFLEERCITGDPARGASAPAARFRAEYEAFCHEIGETPVKGRALASRLSLHGILVGRDAPRLGRSGARAYGNVALLAFQGDETDADGRDRSDLGIF